MSDYAVCCDRKTIGLCCLCDTLFCRGHEKDHTHPEPQSGEFRDAWIASGLSYPKWMRETPEGKRWDGLRGRQ
jgi:hypothetical protein